MQWALDHPEHAKALDDGRDPRELEAILQESAAIVRERAPLVIAETRHGFVCASAGVDHSNAPEPDTPLRDIPPLPGEPERPPAPDPI